MNRLREIRFFKKVGQWQLASKAQIHQSRISLIENELAEPKEDEKKKLANALGVRTEDIWNGDEIGGQVQKVAV